MTHPVVLISPNSIAREGLSRIISSADFTIISSAPIVSDINWDACDDEVLAVLDTGHRAGQASLVNEVLTVSPKARCVVLVDEFDYDGMLQCFEQNAQGYIVKDMPCSPLITSLQLASLGEKIVPSGLIEVVLRQSAYPLSGQADSQQIDRATLSQREMDVLCCLTAGYPNKLIAREYDISPRTIEVYRANVMTKMQASSLSELVRLAMRAGMLND